MEYEQLKFTRWSPSWSDYLVLEARINDELVAVLYHEGGIWKIDFLPQNEQYLRVSWNTYMQIHQRFTEFLEEEKKHPPM